MLEQAIADVQLIEQSICGSRLSDLRVRLALRTCLSELRSLASGREISEIGDLSRSVTPRN